MAVKIGILATHPVQYHVPVYRYLAQQIPDQLHVFFCSHAGYAPIIDKGFGKIVQWDVPLLDGYDLTFLPVKGRDPGPGLHYFTDFWRQFREAKCEALLIWNTYSSVAFPRYLWEARRQKVPVIYRGDTYQNPEGNPLKRRAKRIYLRWVFRWVDHFLATGTWGVQFYRDLGISSSRITVAPYAIDNDLFWNAAAKLRLERQSLRAELGLRQETVVFNLTGKYHSPKRPLDLIRAAALCADLPIHLLLVGEGEMRQVLDEEIRRLNLTNVTLTGFVNQSQLPRYYVASDVAVVCSTHNPWMTVVNEAMCCSLPLLLSDAIGAAADLLKEGENGYTYPMGNVPELACRIRQFVGNGSGPREEMGDKSRMIIGQWGIPEFAEGLLRAASLVTREGQIVGGPLKELRADR